MGMFTRIVFFSLILLVALIGIKINSFLEVPSVPKLENVWWGHEPEKQDTSIRPFKISVPKHVLVDLKTRLNNTRRLTPPLEGIQQQYGMNTNTLKPILDYWANEYDWPIREQFLNLFPQFKTNIQGLDIHFIHMKPDVPSGTPVLPLLLLHGWPGSVREFYKIIPLLIKAHRTYGFAFEVIAPSLPGYGFSDGAVRPGMGSAQMAVILKNLMLRLKYDQFYVQGGDWGASIVKDMATLFPEHILGLHTNMPIVMGKRAFLKILLGALCPSLVVEKEYEHRMYPLSTYYGNLLAESGYFHIQATKPDTVGVGINDSPAGLAAYVLEKFSTATKRIYKEREDGGLLEEYTYDELIDNLMYYWIPQSFTTAVRLYAEANTKEHRGLKLDDIPISMDVPCAVAMFPNDLTYYPDWILKEKYANLVHRTNFKKGGHFAAFEMPETLSQDIFEAVNVMRNLKSK